jgi:L-iditol 2-dehydrogenase
MLAVVKERPGPGFALREVPIPDPPPGWVRVRVRAAGICGTDLPIFDGTRAVALPLIPGHEVTGQVDQAGDGTGYLPGERVAVSMVVACGHCRYCAAGAPELCDSLIELGIHMNGGFAEYMVAPPRNLHRLPEGLSFEDATAADPLACAFHGLGAAEVGSDDIVAVFGTGTLALYAVQVARLAGARHVIALGRRAEGLAAASRAGADVTVDLRAGDPSAAVRRVGPGGPSVVVEATGANEVLPLAVEVASRAGRVVLLGIYRGEAHLAAEPIVRKELRLLGRLCYTIDEYRHCLELIAAGRVRPVQSRHMALAQMSEALELIRQRRAGKVIVRP